MSKHPPEIHKKHPGREVKKTIDKRSEPNKANLIDPVTLEQLIYNSPHGIYLIDLTGTIVAVNQAGAEHLGKTVEQIKGTLLRDYFPDDVSQKRAGKGREAIQLRQTVTFEDQIEGRWYRSTIIPITDKGRRITHLAIYGVNTTEYHHALEALRKTESLYRLHFEYVSDVIYSIDPNFTLINISPSVERVLGYKPEKLLRRPFQELNILAPEYVGQAASDIMRVLRGERIPSVVYQFIARDGTRRWGEVSGAPLIEDGRVAAVVSVARDITERKHAEEALQQSEERYRSLVENTLDGYFMCEIPSGRFIFLNQRICDLAGYAMEEGLRLTLWDVVDPDEHTRIGERIQARMEGKAPPFASNIYRAIRKDGSRFRAEISTSLVTYQGKPVMQGVLRDITEGEKLQAQLQHAQKMEAIGTLAGGIAHDFNNLLMGIQGRTSLMMAEVDPSYPVAEHLMGIEEYIKSATELTKQLLGFARAGKYEVKPTDLNELLKNSSQLFGRTKKEISIYHKLQKDLWAVEADKKQIEQVLLNLYVNAWQAMPAGGELYLQTENAILDEDHARTHFVQPGKYVKVSITDTGVGMDEATRQKVFDPFFTTKEMGRGTGLGLASAFGIIKNHKGTINVYSEKGKGTTFTMYLPASEKQIVKEKEPVMEMLKGSETVLLVDDEQMVLDVGVPMLEKLGYRVIPAKDGRAAIERYQEKIEEIAMVILDMIMPEMNGGETYDRLKEINPDIKVLLSSGYSINGHAQEILSRGCNGFIQKPFRLIDLSQKLREILDQG